MSPNTPPVMANVALPDTVSDWELELTIISSPTPVPVDCGSGDGCGSSCASACVS
ncbi:FxLD family lanthipeptide [Streptomyces sp. NPDC001809]